MQLRIFILPGDHYGTAAVNTEILLGERRESQTKAEVVYK